MGLGKEAEVVIRVEEFLVEENSLIRISAEKQLLAAVLKRAIVDLTDAESKIREDAFYWFNSTDNEDYWGSFSQICLNLDIADPARLKRAILAGAPVLRSSTEEI